MNSVDAHCFSCGYDQLLMIGSLMSNYEVYAAGPVHCKSCQAITTANYKSPLLTCETCKSSNILPINTPEVWLDDSDLIELLPFSTTLSKSDVPSLTGHYKCPKCEKFEVLFGTNHANHGIRSADWMCGSLNCDTFLWSAFAKARSSSVTLRAACNVRHATWKR